MRLNFINSTKKCSGSKFSKIFNICVSFKHIQSFPHKFKMAKDQKNQAYNLIVLEDFFSHSKVWLLTHLGASIPDHKEFFNFLTC